MAENFAPFSSQLCSKSASMGNFRLGTRIEPCGSVSVVQNTRRVSLIVLDFWLCHFQNIRSGSIKWPTRPLYGLSYNTCDFTHSFAGPGSIVLPFFTRNEG